MQESIRLYHYDVIHEEIRSLLRQLHLHYLYLNHDHGTTTPTTFGLKNLGILIQLMKHET